MLTGLAAAKNEDLGEVRLTAYVEALGGLELEAVRLACQRAMRESTFFPQASELYQWASWEWGRRWRERGPHQPTCCTPTRCELEQDRARRRS